MNFSLPFPSTDPPLFLKFINYLCNDAVHLLDEALRMMKEIRDKEQEKLKGEWQALPERERQEKENQLQTVIKHSRCVLDSGGFLSHVVSTQMIRFKNTLSAVLVSVAFWLRVSYLICFLSYSYFPSGITTSWVKRRSRFWLYSLPR